MTRHWAFIMIFAGAVGCAADGVDAVDDAGGTDSETDSEASRWRRSHTRPDAGTASTDGASTDGGSDGGLGTPTGTPTVCTGQCVYVRAGATGANDGSDWTNAYTSLPPNLLRGATYFIAGGSYSGRTFDTPESGTSVITIKGATVADHGSNAGWSNGDSVESTQATWTSGVAFNTSYWSFDGNAGPTWSKTPRQYGFTFVVMEYPISIFNRSRDISDVAILHVAATAPSPDIEKIFVRTDNQTRAVSNVTIGHSYGSGWGNFHWATSPGLTMVNWVIEYNVVLDGTSTATHHGEDLNNNYAVMDPWIIRYNWFEGRRSGTGCIVANNNDNRNVSIYGNVFKDMAAGNGIITGTSAGTLRDVSVYNNTFINVDNGYGGGQWIGGKVTGAVYDNVVYGSNASIGSNVTQDYNAYFSVTNAPSEPNGQVGAGSPFVSLSGGDLHLSAPTSAGMALAAPYKADVEGHTRGADGTWDRGAYEFVK